MTVVYDTGALIAAERGDRDFLALHATFLNLGYLPVVPAAVLAQAWRDPARQVGLIRLLRGCRVVGLDRTAAERVGVRAGRTSVNDVVDCSVADTVVALGAVVYTSDPKDLAKAGVPARQVRNV